MKATLWNDLHPNDPPRHGLIILDAPSKAGDGSQYVACGGEDSEKLNETAERLFALFDDRYRSGRQTIVTTNAVRLADLGGMLGDKGGRITSRLAECAQVHIIKAKDFRAKVAQGRLIGL